MGTRFMCTVEAEIHDNIKQKIVQSTEADTVHIFRTLSNTARVFRNKVSEEGALLFLFHSSLPLTSPRKRKCLVIDTPSFRFASDVSLRHFFSRETRAETWRSEV